jgi:hypothetical protein
MAMEKGVIVESLHIALLAGSILPTDDTTTGTNSWDEECWETNSSQSNGSGTTVVLPLQLGGQHSQWKTL